MEHSNELIEIFAGNSIQALALKYELENAGIPCMIRNDQEAGNLVGIGSIQADVRILIEEVNMGKARPILDVFLEKNAD
ncbi:MAG TPA: DUF2007 domain-containing protein [Bacteroidales bacterium]|jgi:hypothetical protein|nr:DUF2007 domain-containing protein [Bacteroidales bacterium]HPE42542.1 DUF2007 domain-containing protein [Bacteroidales bacterium]